MNVSIIIVSYNTAHLIADCLKSVQNSSETKKEIYVVDNASSDNSVELIASHFPDVKLLVNKDNRGFSAANNQGLLHCNGRYVIFLNPDTTIAQDTLEKAVSYMDENQHIGLAGAKILNPDGSLQESVSYKYPGERFALNEFAGLKGNIACVLGAFMIARKPLLDEIHGFDEDFFLYGEDQDLCWRIREKGHSIGYIENAKVFHWGGQSEIKTPPVTLFEKKLKAEYLFYKKHYTLKTIAHIKKSHRRKAVYRLVTLKWSVPLTRDKAKLLNKIECYKIVLKMTQT
jgi:N-acetylglucosaminyl-diphospho-decaprenol L-rhamnosyltransferase